MLTLGTVCEPVRLWTWPWELVQRRDSLRRNGSHQQVCKSDVPYTQRPRMRSVAGHMKLYYQRFRFYDYWNLISIRSDLNLAAVRKAQERLALLNMLSYRG